MSLFKLFSKKREGPTVTPEDKEWIEESLTWFMETFGTEKLLARPFIVPSVADFPYDDLNDPEQFQRLFEQICTYYGLDAGTIAVKFFDDIKSMQWSTWVPQSGITEPGGLYYRTYDASEKPFKIDLAKSSLDNPQLLVTIIAHELAHVKLLGGHYMRNDDPNLEPFTDLACLYFGFGIFAANSCQTRSDNWMSRFGYLPNEVISYTNALLCYMAAQDPGDYLPYLNTNTKELFRNDHAYLLRTEDTLLSPNKVKACTELYGIYARVSNGFEQRSFEQVISASMQLLQREPKNVAAHNNIGYALLLQKQYQQAITHFTNAIAIEPYWEYPYNNRGYCHLQLGDLDQAYTDLYSSFEMNSQNSFAWRNLGAYYIITNELDKALTHLDTAYSIDPKTELIHFYLGQVHLKLGNQEKAESYFAQSTALNEHNDSMM